MIKMENKYYSNFKRFDSKGNRYSIFGREVNGELEIWKLKCSREDVENNLFSKQLAKSIYNTYLHGTPEEYKIHKFTFHPTIEYIPLEGNKPEYMFERYCSLYYRMVNDKLEFVENETDKLLGIISYSYLRQHDEFIPLGQPKWKKYE